MERGGWNHTFHVMKRHMPDNLKQSFGSQWWCLNYQTVKWICDYLSEHMEYLEFYRHSLCPDESFFQTLVVNSPYDDTVNPYLHYIKWEAGKSSPEILKLQDYDEIIKSHMFMARKFDIYIDKKIIDKLEKRIDSKK